MMASIKTFSAKKSQKQDSALVCRQLLRELSRCAAPLARTAEEARRAALRAEQSGRHQDALRQARLSRTVGAMQSRIDETKLRVEMVLAMGGASEKLTKLFGGCAQTLSQLSALSARPFDAAALERTLCGMDVIFDQSAQLIDLPGENAPADPEAEAALKDILAQQSAAQKRDQLYGDHRRALSAIGEGLAKHD